MRSCTAFAGHHTMNRSKSPYGWLYVSIVCSNYSTAFVFQSVLDVSFVCIFVWSLPSVC